MQNLTQKITKTTTGYSFSVCVRALVLSLALFASAPCGAMQNGRPTEYVRGTIPGRIVPGLVPGWTVQQPLNMNGPLMLPPFVMGVQPMQLVLQNQIPPELAEAIAGKRVTDVLNFLTKNPETVECTLEGDGNIIHYAVNSEWNCNQLQRLFAHQEVQKKLPVLLAQQDGEFYTPLLSAITSGDIDVALFLIEQGAPVDAAGGLFQENPPVSMRSNMFHIAASDGWTCEQLMRLSSHTMVEPFVQKLLREKNFVGSASSVGRTPLFVAIHERKIDTALALIELGAPLWQGATHSFTNGKTFKCYGYDDNVLHAALAAGWSVEQLTQLVAQEQVKENLQALFEQKNKFHQNPLFHAILVRNVDAALFLIASGAPVDSVGGCNKKFELKQFTILHAAAAVGWTGEELERLCGTLQVKEKLRDLLFQLDATGNDTPIITALKEKNASATLFFIKKFGELGVPVEALLKHMPLLHFAARGGWAVEQVKALCEFDFIKRNSAQLLQVQLQVKRDNLSPFEIALKYNQHAIAVFYLRLLCANGEPENIRGLLMALMRWQDPRANTIIHVVARDGSDEDLTFLLDLGERNFEKCYLEEFLARKNDQSETALFYAKTKYAAKLLLAKGVPVDQANNYFETALNVACRRGELEVVKQLVEHKAMINHVSGLGCTPLHYAALKGNIPLIACLLEKGADPFAVVQDKHLMARSQGVFLSKPSSSKTFISLFKARHAGKTEEFTKTIAPILSQLVARTYGMPISGIDKKIDGKCCMCQDESAEKQEVLTFPCCKQQCHCTCDFPVVFSLVEKPECLLCKKALEKPIRFLENKNDKKRSLENPDTMGLDKKPRQ